MAYSHKSFPVTHTAANTAGAPTVLLIHGFLDDATVWDEVVERLGGEIGAVRYDLPGFGARSGSVHHACGTTLAALAAEAGDIVLGIDGPVIVVGQSLGAQVAELVAAQHPTRVHGLVLLTPVPLRGTQLPSEAVAPFRALGGNRQAQRRARAELSPHLSDQQLDRRADIGVRVAPEIVSHYVGVWNEGVADAPVISAYGGPALIVRGGEDAFVTEQLLDGITPRFPEAELKVIDEGGHWLHLEFPGALAAMILDFADTIGGVTS